MARTAVPNARYRSLDRVLATKHTVVLGVLRDFNLLDDFTERGTVTRTVLATNTNFFRSLALQIPHYIPATLQC